MVTATTVQVYDYLIGSDGKPISGVQVKVSLNYGQASTTTPVAALSSAPQIDITDSNGYWAVNLVPTDNPITPSGVLYQVEIPGRPAYLINPVATGVPGIGWQSSAILVSAPVGLGVQGFFLPDGTEVKGALIVDGGANGFSADANGNLAGRSFTAKASGPNNPAPGILAGEEVTGLNPTNAKAYGVRADGQFVSDGVMNGTTAVLTSASGLFKSTDVGKLILVPGAGAAGALLSTTIASFQSTTQVTLAAVSQTAVSAGTHGQVGWGTDDSAAWIAVQAAVLAGARIIIPWGYSFYQGVFMGGITKSMSLEGLGCSEMFGTVAQSVDTTMPGIAPYVTGSVIVQCQAATDAMQITGTGITVHRRNFAVKFADGIAFTNTGHGVYAVSTATVSGGHENGSTGSREDNLIVFGHDGNHFAYYSVNDNLTTSDHLRSYGGGVMHLECDSFVSSYGNAVHNAPYGSLFCGGTANGYEVKSRNGTFPGQLNLVKFTRPQVNIQAVPSQFSAWGIAAPTIAQYLYQTLGSDPQAVDVEDPDFEGFAFSNPVNFGSVGTTVTVRGGLIAPGTITQNSADQFLRVGIRWPATPAPVTDTHTLDEYTESTNGSGWTPGISFGGASSGVTYSTQAGYYIKIGRLVFATARIVLTSKGISTGNVLFTGLPYSALTGNRIGGAFAMTFNGLANLSNLQSILGNVVQGSTTVQFVIIGQNAATAILQDTNFTNTTDFSFTAMYLAAA